MPELPEVEVLARHLRPLLAGQRIRRVDVCRAKVVRPQCGAAFAAVLRGARFERVARRGKYLVFSLRGRSGARLRLLGHIGMTGRMHLQAATEPLPRHAAVVLRLDHGRFVYEDTRYFGRLTLDGAALARLGPEPLGPGFTARYFEQALRRSGQAIKPRLLDQALVAGVGNIYASEALCRARISPRRRARQLTAAECGRLRRAVRAVLWEAIAFGSTVPLRFSSRGVADGLFYYGRAAGTPDSYTERLRVYARAGQPCGRCGTRIRRLVQAARSTYYCPQCQR